MKATYVPSGEFDAVRLLTALAAMTGTALAFAAVMTLAMLSGAYFFVILPGLAAVGLNWVSRKLVLYAHLRNPWLGAGIGGFFGALMFLAIYFGMFVYELGIDAFVYVDFFPDYLYAVVNEQVISINFREGMEPSPIVNWSIFAIELVLCSSMSGEAWYNVSRQPYCERCNSWLPAVGTAVSKSRAVAIAQAVDHEELDTLPGFEPLLGEPPETYGEIKLCGCLHGGDESQTPLLYLTISNVTRTQRGLQYKHHLEHREVSADDIAVLAARCPGLFG